MYVLPYLYDLREPEGDVTALFGRIGDEVPPIGRDFIMPAR
jgi:hypothetical protein